MFFDVDGTLMFGKKVEPSVREALCAAKAAGHGIFLNTARSRAFIPETLAELDWDGMVCGMAYTEYRGECLMNECIPTQVLLRTADYCLGRGIPVRFEGVGQVLTTADFDPFRNIAAEYREVLPTADDITKLTVLCPIGDEEAKELSLLYDVIRFPTYTELVQKGMTKAVGMLRIAERERMPRSRLVAFGDSLNDREMLACAGIGVIMKNAPAELEEVAAIRASEETTGVAEVLYGWFL